MKCSKWLALALCVACAFGFMNCISVRVGDAAYIYSVNIADDITNGTVTVSKSEKIASGEKITLTITPANGYELDTLTVTNATNGKAVKVTDNEFRMPDSDASVVATFNKCAATKAKPDAIGDVVLNDGTVVAYENIGDMTDKQKEKAMAVIFYIGQECSNNGEKRTLGVGLLHGNVAWCSDTASTRKIGIPLIESKPNGSKGNYTFSGDKDGSDNLEAIGSFLIGKMANDTKTPTNYPAFYYAKNYKDFKISEQVSTSFFGNMVGQGNYRNRGTNVSDKYKDGWYLPTIAELFQLWKNKDKVESASTLCGGSAFNTNTGIGYLSSSTDEEKGNLSYLKLLFSTGECEGKSLKGVLADYGGPVCAIRAF